MSGSENPRMERKVKKTVHAHPPKIRSTEKSTRMRDMKNNTK
jgi:hypothetical protein